MQSSKGLGGAATPIAELAVPSLSACHGACHLETAKAMAGAIPLAAGRFDPPPLQVIFQTLDVVRERDWYRQCGTDVLLYRGAWQVLVPSADGLVHLLHGWPAGKF